MSQNLPLDVEWQFAAKDTLDWMPAKVPGCVHTDLEQNAIIENPLLGTNETKCQWIEKKEWVYQTLPFSVPGEVFSQDIIRLKFSQLDTYSKVFLNDTFLLETSNAFRSYEIDVKPFLNKDLNILRIEFSSPISEGEKRINSLGHPLPGDAMRAVTRKPQYHYGWDWGPRLVTSGITGPIEWIAYSDIQIKSVYFDQLFISKERVELEIEITAHVHRPGEYTFHVADSTNHLHEGHTSFLEKGINTLRIPMTVKNPKLWWSNGLGEAYQYSFLVEGKRNNNLFYKKNYSVGLRNIELITERDDSGETFYFKLNGQPVFAKGANYIPITMLPERASKEDYLQLLKLCKASNFNMLRVWGGGYYEKDSFYEICDSLGIMVWQDFMFACSMYPGNPAFIENVREEADQQTKRLRNHACLALWCGNNENAEGWARWGWQQNLSAKDKKTIEAAYNDVFAELLPEIVFANHAQINYWESSPRFGRGDSKSLTEGDCHYWGLWHDEEPFEILLQKIPRFMSEFGMQSFPNKKTFDEMLTMDTFSWDDPGLVQHQKHSRGNKLMREYTSRWFDIDDSLKNFASNPYQYLQLTQSMQAEGMLMGIEAERRAAPYCMGTLFWQLNDVWPSFSWSAIDYKMEPKIFMNGLKEIYANELLSPYIENNFLYIHYINDTSIEAPVVNLQYQIMDSDRNVLTQSYVRYIALKEPGVIYSAPWIELIKDRDPENLIISITCFTMDGQIYLQREAKLTAKSSDGLMYISTPSNPFILTKISD